MRHLSLNKLKYLFTKRYNNITIQSLSSSSSDSTSASSFTESRDDDTDVRIAEKPVSYFPKHLAQNRRRPRIRRHWKVKEMVTMYPEPDPPPEWTETPEYPPIVDISLKGKQKRFRMEWYECIKRLPSVEQKLYEISKHHALLSIIMGPVSDQYNLLPMQQYITRTHLINGTLPHGYDQNVDQYLETVKEPILSSVRTHLFQSKQRIPTKEMRPIQLPRDGSVRIDAALQEDIIHDVAKIVKNALINNCNHLLNVQCDFVPYVSSFWWHKDFPPPFDKKWFKNPQIDQAFVYKGTHALHLRTNKPLAPVIPIDDPLSTCSEIPNFPHNPARLGLKCKREGLPIIPGFWPDRSDGFNFPNMIFLSRHEMKEREKRNQRSYSDTQQILDGMAIMSSFAWLNGFAANNGFTVYHEVTYPFVTHVVITDGQYWSFYVYQLNTHTFHSDVDTDSRRNVCWSSGDLKLFDSFQDGQLKGVNDDVIKHLIRFFLKEPQKVVDYELYPYLGNDERPIEEIREMSGYLRDRFTHKFPIHKAVGQRVYLWEQIYKNHPLATPTPHLRVRPKIRIKWPPFFTK